MITTRWKVQTVGILPLLCWTPCAHFNTGCWNDLYFDLCCSHVARMLKAAEFRCLVQFSLSENNVTHKLMLCEGGGVMGWEGGLYRIRFILYFIAEAEASEVTVGWLPQQSNAKAKLYYLWRGKYKLLLGTNSWVNSCHRQFKIFCSNMDSDARWMSFKILSDSVSLNKH